MLPRFGVILLNMGGPTDLDAVRPFLENLFLDREIISFGPMEFARRPLARLIAKRRAAVVRGNYRMIGGKSPLADLTHAQARALEGELSRRYADRAAFTVAPGFSYWHPFIAEAVDAMDRDAVREVFLLPLYPHYSRATSGSCFKTWRDIRRARGNGRYRPASVKSYPELAEYIAAVNARIDEGLAAFPAERRARVALLFSAHGTPMSLVRRGDPYADEIRRTVRAVMTARGDALPHRVSFQSKVGPAKWLEPNTVDETRALAAAGVRDLLVVPIAFVSDHVETLHELDIELRREAAQAGIEHFRVTGGLNDSPLFIRGLAHLVARSVDARLARHAGA